MMWKINVVSTAYKIIDNWSTNMSYKINLR